VIATTLNLGGGFPYGQVIGGVVGSLALLLAQCLVNFGANRIDQDSPLGTSVLSGRSLEREGTKIPLVTYCKGVSYGGASDAAATLNFILVSSTCH
jgi:hypothetical protein